MRKGQACPQKRAKYNEQGQKFCRVCGEWKSPDEFEPRKDVWDGRCSKCRECQNAYRRSKYVKRGRGPRGQYNMTPEGSAAIAQSARERMTGANNPNWKGGITTQGWRQSSKYRRWRNKVFKRDRYTCRKCGDDAGSNLTAHHILSADEYPDLRYEVDNGLTLCEDCHSKIHGTPVRGSRHKYIEMTVCQCGCGMPMKRWATPKSTRPRRYLTNHFIRLLHERKRQDGNASNQDWLG